MNQQANPAPKRISAKNSANNSNTTNQNSSNLPNDIEFQLPEFELNLDFFMNRGNEDFTVASFVQKAFGDVGSRLTPTEQVFITVKALQDLEIIAPLEFQCEHCNANNPVAIELAKVMQVHGSSKDKFFIQFASLKDPKNLYIFEFHRPVKFIEVKDISSNIANVGLFMLQWLEAHNQGENFDVTKMQIKDFIELVRLFGTKMLDVTFHTEFKCNKCKKNNKQEFSIQMQDLIDVLNDL